VSAHLWTFNMLFPRCREKSIIICKYIAGKFVHGDAASSSELEGVIPRGLLFYKLQRGLQHRAVAEYTRDTQPYLVYARGTDQAFSRRRLV